MKFRARPTKERRYTLEPGDCIHFDGNGKVKVRVRFSRDAVPRVVKSGIDKRDRINQ